MILLFWHVNCSSIHKENKSSSMPYLFNESWATGVMVHFLQHQPNYLSAQLLRGCNNTPSFENAGRLMHHFNSTKADWDHLPVIGTWRQAAALVNHFHTFLHSTITLKRHYHTSQSSSSIHSNFLGLKLSLCCVYNNTCYFLFLYTYLEGSKIRSFCLPRQPMFPEISFGKKKKK